MKKSLRGWRRDRDFTQAQMANEIGVSLATYQTYERCPGQIRLHTLFRICEVLKVGINDIQYWTGDTSKILYVEETKGDE